MDEETAENWLARMSEQADLQYEITQTTNILIPALLILAGIFLLGAVWAAFSRRVFASILLSILTAAAAGSAVLAEFWRINAISSGPGAPFMFGDPLIFQHLMWLMSQPVIYVLISKLVLLAIGFVWCVRTALARRHHLVAAGIVLAGLALLTSHIVAAHSVQPMFIEGRGAEISWQRWPVYISSMLALAVPVAALFRFRAQIPTNLIGFLFLLTGGAFLLTASISGWVFANAGIDDTLHDTYFVVVHVQYLLWLAMPFAVFALFYYGFRSLIGTAYNRWLARAHFLTWTLGTALLAFPPQFIGLQGMPRRYPDYSAGVEQVQIWPQIGSLLMIVSFGAFALVIGEGVYRRVHSVEKDDPA